MACLSLSELEQLAGSAEAIDATAQAHLDTCPRCRQELSRWQRHVSMAARLNAAFPELLGRPPADATQDVGLEESPTPQDAAPRAPAAPAPPAAPASEHLPALPDIAGYELLREIHRGGQGAVYEAIQLSTRRTVAVKVLLENPLGCERARWRFEREVKLIAALRHPHIVIIHDSGVSHGRYYFAMDYVRGQPLDTHVRLTRPALRPLIALFRQICDAVACAHRRGVIHRDLKPSNILVDADGVPCVLDFGLAKTISEELSESQQGLISIVGGLMGTIRYMAPEQTLGKPDAIDVRTDVYALGVILYELLTGLAPYATNTDLARALQNIREVDPVRPTRLRRSLSQDLETIMLKAMEKEPARRYQSAGELTEDLSAWLDGRPIAARSASSLYVIRKLAVRHSFETLVLTALVLFMGGVLFAGGRKLMEWRAATQAARAGQQSSEQALAEKDEGLAKFQQEALGGLRGIQLQAFLAAWRADRLEEARDLYHASSPGSEERAVMGFLLDDGRPVDTLLAALPEDAGALAWLAAGERYRKQGRQAEAAEAFEASRAAVSPRYGWVEHLAGARLVGMGGTQESHEP